MLRPCEKRLVVVAARQAVLRRRQGRIRRPLLDIDHPRNELQAVAGRRPACAASCTQLKTITTGGKAGVIEGRGFGNPESQHNEHDGNVTAQAQYGSRGSILWLLSSRFVDLCFKPV